MTRPRLTRRVQLALVFALPSVGLALVAALTYGHFRIDVPARLGPAARADAVRVIRSVLEGGPPIEPTDPALVGLALPDHGPVVVTLWRAGKPVVRVEGRGRRAAPALAAAAAALAHHPGLPELDRAAREDARIGVDVVVGRGPILTSPRVLSLLSLHPGLEGLGVALPDGRELVVGPDDLARSGALFAEKPVPSIPELSVGLDWAKLDRALAAAARLSPAEWAGLDKRFFRLRVDGFVERSAGQRAEPPLPLTRGVPPAPPATADNLRAAALSGGQYLIRHLSPAGRYVYEVNLATGKATDPNKRGAYSLPRHAGTTYFLAELYRLTGDPSLREPIERAFGHLAKLVNEGGCRGTTDAGRAFACVIDRGDKQAVLGSTALAVVALVEYRRATADPRFDDLARELTEWILWLRRADGSFAHVYDVRGRAIDWATQLPYFTGEAALALARMYEVHGDPRYLTALEAALDHLTAWYDFFAGGFFYGEEHWTCIASAAAWPHLQKRRYLDFCLGYGDFLRRTQFMVGDFDDQDDLAGAYGMSPFVVPNNTPAGSRTEAMISTYELAQHHGVAAEALRRQILRSVALTLGQQVRDDSAFAVVPAADGLGAVPGSPLDRTVRIDYVQHVCSAMVRAVPLVDRP